MTTPKFNRYSWLACLCGMLVTSAAQTAPGGIADAPLFTATSSGGGVPSNIFFQIDDSGSMDWDTLTKKYWNACMYDPQNAGILANTPCPSSIHDNGNINTYMASIPNRNYYSAYYNCTALTFCEDIDDLVDYTSATIKPSLLYEWRARAAALNGMYYNPNVTYEPWKIGDGTRCSNASFTGAKNSPTPFDCAAVNPTTGIAVAQTTVTTNDLTGFVFEVAHDTHGYTGTKPSLTAGGTSTSKKIGTVITTTIDEGINRSVGANGMVDFWDEHTTYTVNASGIDKTEVIYTPSKTSPNTTKTTSGNRVTITKIYTQNLNPSSTTTTLTTGLNGRTLTAEKQNIANWYQYYRQRINVAKASVAQVIDNNPKYRYGFNTIWNKDFVEVPASTISTDSEYKTYNKGLLTKLFARPPANGTPLPDALNRVGQYFMHQSLPSIGSTTGTGATYANPITYDCQQNFGILQTDGYWNDDLDATAQTLIKDKDGDGVGLTHSTLADVARYYYVTDLDGNATNNKVPTNSFDTNAQQHMVTYTVAFGLDGNLIKGSDGWPTPALTESGDNKSTLAVETGLWGTAVNGGITDNIDDLWHAAYNGRGLYVSASSPEAIAAGFKQIFDSITQRDYKGSATSASFNVSTVSGGNSAYVSQFGLVDNIWSGDLLAYDVDPATGAVALSPRWKASTWLDALTTATSSRHIFTYNTSVNKGVPFQWQRLSNNPTTSPTVSLAQQDLGTDTSGTVNTGLTTVTADVINGTAVARLHYLRGDQSNEGVSPYNFRTRSYTDPTTTEHHNNLLGDIIHSDPAFVSAPRGAWPTRYPFPTGGTSGKLYRNFRALNSGRTPMVYVGANDGMLHGFNALDGSEAMGYIPHTLFSSSAATIGLHYLTNAGYVGQNHHYYVDAPPVTEDVYIDTGDVGVRKVPCSATGACWHTVLVGGLGAGGRGIYALDITDPGLFLTEDDTNAAKLALWEFNSTVDPDMGYSFSVPNIVMMNNGRWAAVFGNGYNNTGSGKAVLFIVFLDGGVDGVWTDGSGSTDQDYIKITVTNPSTNPNGADPTTTGSDCLSTTVYCNGLSTPQAVDLDNDSVIDRIYAGDLKGNMWAFDVSTKIDAGTLTTSPPRVRTDTPTKVTTSDWKVAYETSGVGVPLFTASHHITPYGSATPPAIPAATGVPVQQKLCTRNSVAVACRQAITSRPTVIRNKKSYGNNWPNMLVMFGTGQYLNSSDTSNKDMQGFYAVWDHNVGSLTPATPTASSATTPGFVEQTFEAGPFYDSTGTAVTNIRVLTKRTVTYNSTTATNHGWFINLSKADGERQVVNTDILDEKYLFFNTWIPAATTATSTNSCTVEGNASGSGYLMSVDLFTGGEADKALFDLNKDSVLTSGDTVQITINSVTTSYSPSGRSYDTGLPGSSSFVKGTQYTPGTDAGTNLSGTTVVEATGEQMRRRAWQELRSQ